MKFQTLSFSGYFSLVFLLFLFFFVFTARTITVVAANPPSSEAGNLTLSVESVPVKNGNGSGPQSLLQRLNVRVSSAWSKFKCQFYTRATVPVSKMLNVKIPRSMELSNITNCHQLNVVVGQLANSSTDSIVDLVVGLESEASTARTNAADNGTSTAKNSESPGPTTSSTPPSTEVVTESATTVPSSPPSTSSSELSSTTSLSPVTTTSAAPETTATSAPSTETVSTSTVASVVGDNNSQSTTVSAPEELSTPEQKPVVGATN